MKIKPTWFALILFTLAAGLRVEAQVKYYDGLERTIRQYGGPGDLSSPPGTLTQDSDGNVYVALITGDPSHYFGGIDELSGSLVTAGDWNGDGTVTHQIIEVFPGGINGAYPSTGVVWVNGILFGATSGGGAAGVGVLFAKNILGGALVTSSFSAPDAMDVYANGIAVGPNEGSNGTPVYVSQQTGGPSGNGAVLKQYFTASGLVVTAPPVSLFTGDDGKYPFVVCADALFGVKSSILKHNGPKPEGGPSTNYTFYGTTFFGGTNAADTNSTDNYGTVYKVNNDGSGFQTLYVFSSQRATNGYGPACGLALSGNTLFGTTSGGGANGSGEIFRIDTNGSNFSVIKSFSSYGPDASFNFTNSDGQAPEGDLLLAGDTLYGTTLEGGTNGGGGVVYSMKTNGGNFSVLFSFSNPTDNGTGTGTYTNRDGGGTRAGLLLSGNTLFGTTPYGGTYGGGTVFAIRLPSPPLLTMAPSGGNVAVSWPSSATNFMLQENLTLNALTWSNFNGAVNDDGTNKTVSVIPTTASAFFRLLSTNGL
jgi:uncharacterized repeat protein (TIGR03803 family)